MDETLTVLIRLYISFFLAVNTVLRKGGRHNQEDLIETESSAINRWDKII